METRIYRGRPPYSQGSASDVPIERLGTIGVDDMQAPERPDPMMGITNGIGAGTFLPDSYASRKSQDTRLVAPENKLYQSLGKPIDMADASSNAPDGESAKKYGPVFPGGK